MVDGTSKISFSTNKLVISISLERDMTTEMQQLREMSYDDYVCGPDTFDRGKASHVTAWHKSLPVGMVRLTPGPPFALVEWSFGEFKPPPDPSLIEMTRGIVHPDFRRHGVYKALMIESLLRAQSMNMCTAIAAVEPDFVGKAFLHSLGFVDFGLPCWFDKHFFAQPIRCDLTYQDRWRAMYRRHVRKMLEINVEIMSELIFEHSQ